MADQSIDSIRGNGRLKVALWGLIELATFSPEVLLGSKHLPQALGSCLFCSSKRNQFIIY